MRGYSARARAIVGVLAMIALAAAIVLPSLALAKTTFSAKKPVSGSSSVVSTPTISVYIVDTYGIKGTTSFSMKIDGKAVKPKITYKINKKKRDYKRVTLSFRVTSSLQVGPHTVVVKIKNTHKKTATVTWKFTVKSPPGPPTPPQPTAPEPMPVTIAASNCGACHVGYPASHPMTECGLCHGGGRPQGEPAYGPGDESAHTLGCALDVPCHGGGGTFPHALDADCAGCHSGAYAGIGVRHASIDAEPAHVSSSAGCTVTGCHLSSLTVEHYRRSISGVKLSCATCHSSTDARVIAAIRARSTACGGCHSLTTAHAITAGSHTVSNECISAGCHVASVIAVHGATGGPGCDACHGAGRTPSLVCASCHAGSANQVHAKAAVAHTTTSGTCVTALCHLADITAIHGVTGGPGCPACHAAGKTPSADCVTCHPGALEVIHPRIGTAHTAPVDGCVSSVCHARDVTTVHGAAGGPGCAACHKAGVSARIACASCHVGDLTGRHSSATAKHTASPSNGCVSAACHSANVAALHGVAGGPGCAACHGPGKIASTTCPPCHSSNTVTVHPLAVTKHTAPAGTCVSSSCHTASVITIHGAPGGPGCPACHAASKTLTLVCTVCHTADLVALHPVADAKHSAPVGTCAQAGCHTANAALIHRALAGSGCSTCHGPGKTPSLVCVTCHTGDLTPRHPSANGAHTAPASSCVTAGCHMASVAAIHGAVGGPGCAACHAPGKTPSLTCATCHPGDVTTLHAGATAKHAAPKSTCVQTGCHATDAATSHTQAGGPGCAACHAAGVTASITCAACHTGDLTARHPSAAASHRAPASSCVTAGCHTADAATLHSGAGGPGCAACHAPGKTPSLTCATCHPGNIATLHATATAAHTSPTSTCVQVGCHVADAATLHTRTGGPGCAACHAAGVTASIACVGCHTGDLTSRHASATVAHTAATGLCVSSTCHVANVATIHAAGLGCVDCHGIGRTPSLVCATCHGADLVSLHPVAAARHLVTTATCVQAGCHLTDAARVHAVAGGPGCQACHKSGTVPTLTCVTCHAGGFTTAHPAPATAHTAPAGACVTAGCHLADVVALHTKTTGPGCAACHKTGTTPTLVCASCHSGDVASLHPGAAASHASPASSCVKAGCHVSDVVAIHGAPGGPGCSACHTLGKTPSVVCDSCHLGHGFTLHTGFSAAHIAPGSTCVLGGCHSSDVVSMHGAGNGGTGCTACHPTHAPAGSPGCAACHAAGKTPSIACGDCHSADLRTVHPNSATAHAAPAGACVKAGCHASSVAAVHGAAGGPGCVACHATGKTPTLVCSACHSTNLTTVHPLAAGKHGAPASDCVKAGCHGADVTAVHGAAGGPGCAACHSATATPSLTCATCHAGTIQALHPLAATSHAAPSGSCVKTGCHGADVTVIHGAAGGPGCAACHAAGKVASLTCPDCHPGTFPALHMLSGPPHEAPAGTCVHTGCHVVNVVTVHLHGPSCGACHATGVTPSTTCTTCHGVDPAAVHAAVVGTKHTASASACTSGSCHDADVAALHGVAGGPGCAACHATGKTPSLDCATCHGSFTATHPVPAAAHTAPAAGPCSGCHDTNVATLHGVAGGPSCSACHAVSVTPSTDCSTCHDRSDVAALHPSGAAGHTVTRHPCTAANCHGDNVLTIHQGSFASCNACHMNGPAATGKCDTCHDYDWAKYHASGEALFDYHASKVGTGWTDWGWRSDGWMLAPYARGQSMTCSVCHDLGGTPNLYNFPAVINGAQVSVTKGTEYPSLCRACHGGTLTQWHSGCYDCHTAGHGSGSPLVFEGSDCSDCHRHGGYGWPHGIGWMDGATL